MLKVCWSKSDCDKQTIILSKNSFFKLVTWTRRMQFWQTYEFVFGRKPRILYSRSEKHKKNHKRFQKKYFPSTWSNRNIGWNSDNSAKFFSTKNLKSFCSIYEHFPRIEQVSKENCCLKMFLWTPVLTAPTKFFCGSQKRFTQFPKLSKKLLVLFGKVFFLAMFLWKHRKQFWQPHRFFSPNVEVFSFNVRACFATWIIFKKIFFASERSFGHSESSFDSPKECFMAEGQKLFTRNPKVLKRLTFLFGKLFFFFETFWWKHR